MGWQARAGIQAIFLTNLQHIYHINALRYLNDTMA
jgi:hypothetical protein